MAPYNRRKVIIHPWLGMALLAVTATVLAVALMLTIRYAGGDDFLRKPAAIAAALADISLAITRSERSV
jgi:hypothetical protein